MSVTFQQKTFEFEDGQDAVRLSADITVTPPNLDDKVFVYVTVGAEGLIFVTEGTGQTNGHINQKVAIPKTIRAVGYGQGNKPVTATAFGVWAVKNKTEAEAWIKANAAAEKVGAMVLYMDARR